MNSVSYLNCRSRLDKTCDNIDESVLLVYAGVVAIKMLCEVPVSRHVRKRG